MSREDVDGHISLAGTYESMAARMQSSPQDLPYAIYYSNLAVLEQLRAITELLGPIEARQDIRNLRAARDALDEAEMPWCEPCQSYHVTPRDTEHKTLLKCRAPD